MPKDGFFSKSFVRIVLLELMFANQINWTGFAREKWREKSSITNIHYCEGEGRTYKKAIVENLKANLVRKEEELVGLEAKHRRCHLNMDDVQKQPEVVAKAEKGQVLEEDMRRL